MSSNRGVVYIGQGKVEVQSIDYPKMVDPRGRAIGHGVILHACTIGNRVLVGMGSKILDQVEIEDDVFVAAGSLVTPGKLLKSGWLYGGQPARPMRELKPLEIENLKYSAEHYVRIKNRYLNSGT